MIESILFVEDEFFIAAMTERQLKALGIATIVHAANVAEALDAIERTDFDFALLDVNLGEENSFPIADRLAERGIAHAFMTGYDASFLEERARAALLRKPVRSSELRSILEKQGQRSRAA
ncbi:response regulator [uncultured Parasphingopyxis sp.]|uniref:response regulator n=1 Tax=uncultured Parasphingopyxis sp. TaxID=1547918 RepID=UPI002626D8BB|nr:response regulator [uncultured Parasphingopyxis sp.]